jgi:hypothetical protein
MTVMSEGSDTNGERGRRIYVIGATVLIALAVVGSVTGRFVAFAPHSGTNAPIPSS